MKTGFLFILFMAKALAINTFLPFRKKECIKYNLAAGFLKALSVIYMISIIGLKPYKNTLQNILHNNLAKKSLNGRRWITL